MRERLSRLWNRVYRRENVAKFLVALLLVATFSGAGFVIGETFLSNSYYKCTGPMSMNASDGPEVVITGASNDCQSGQPFTDKSYNWSTQNRGWINVSTSDPDSSQMVVQIDQIGGTYTKASGITATSGNITLDPYDKNETTVGGGITAITFNDMKVEDGQKDFNYTASSSGTIIVRTNASQGTSYGLVNTATEEGLDVAVADANGVIKFTDVPQSTTRTDVRIEELGTLFIREETSPHDKLTSATATVKFFENREEDPVIIERTTQGGEVDLTGLPVDGSFVATIKAPNYNNRSVYIPDLSQQETVFLLNTSRPTVQNTFEMDDRTGKFPGSSTVFIVQKAINRSKYDAGAGWAWTNMAGDRLGPEETFVTNLEKEDRYRIKVVNEDGETRILGEYNAKTSGLQIIPIGRIQYGADTDDGYVASAEQFDDSGSKKIRVTYSDSEDKTAQVVYNITRYRDHSTVIVSDTTVTGPLGEFSAVHNVNNPEGNKSYAVHYEITRGGQTNNTVEFVGGPGGIAGDLGVDPRWLELMGWIGIVAMGGLTAIVDDRLGAFSLVGTATLLTMIGVTSIAQPALGMGGVVAVMYAVGRSR